MESQDSGAPGLHGIHVLVIEDSPGTLDMLTALLRLEGAVAVGVANGRDALSPTDVTPCRRCGRTISTLS